MTQRDWLIVLMAVAYLIGSIPFGLLIGLSKGVDIRQHGSKNIGASNAGRVLGSKKYFFLVFFLDLLKSLIPMLIASWIASSVPVDQRDWLFYLLWISIGMMAMVGHVFPVYLKFKGGKGVATGAGVLLGLFPYFTYAGLLAIGLFLPVVMITRYISVASITSSLSFPLIYIVLGRYWGWDVFGDQLPLLLVATLLALLILHRHKDNIRRLIAGTENKIRSRG